VLRFAVAFFVALSGAAFVISHASAQEGDPLIVPPEGEPGSRFQIVGQLGWIPGESVSIAFAFSEAPPADPVPAAAFTGPQQVTVLRDGTWSFPVVLNEQLFGRPLDTPGFIVVRAESPSRTAHNTFILTVGGRRPVGTPPLSGLGLGPGHPLGLPALALFLAGIGALLVAAGSLRNTAACAARHRPPA
jgi:hypothetical protein